MNQKKLKKYLLRINYVRINVKYVYILHVMRIELKICVRIICINICMCLYTAGIVSGFCLDCFIFGYWSTMI